MFFFNQLSEIKRLDLNMTKFESFLGKGQSYSYSIFKRKMLDMGFSLIDLPDEDLKVE